MGECLLSIHKAQDSIPSTILVAQAANFGTSEVVAEGPVREVKVVLSDKNETFFSIFVVSQNLDFCV